jgi:threonine dehydrogenase-like Zn-dependent dehydrogenase
VQEPSGGKPQEAGGTATHNPNAPGFEDAIAAVKSGDIDLARDIARSLPEEAQKAVENAIGNQEQPKRQPRQTRERGRFGLE